jgi:hypothetical protein
VVFVPLADTDASARAALVTPLECPPLARRFIDLLLDSRENTEQ